MQSFPKTVVWRHKKENLKKCSLRGLECRSDFCFLTYPQSSLPDLTNYALLAVDAPPLSIEDCDKGLFVIDGTWKYSEKMIKKAELQGGFVRRSIPGFYKTAYPRRQEDCIDPERGLASVEAIYIAYHLLNRETKGLLDHYYWKESFLILNQFIDLF